MRYSLPASVAVLGASVAAQQHLTWCGKYYELTAPRTPPSPDSYFVYPPKTDSKLLDFRCTAASSLYLGGDAAADPPAVVVDASVTCDVGHPVDCSDGDQLDVTIYVNHQQVASSQVAVGAYGEVIPISLDSFSPQIPAYHLECRATLGSQTYHSKSELLYLPSKNGTGSAVKLDRRTGGTWVKNGSQDWAQLLPFGFYDSFDNTPITNSSGNPFNNNQLANLHSLGFNLVNPVPPGQTYADTNGSSAVIDDYFVRTNALGLWVMYDTRNALENITSIEMQVREFMDRPSLLTWYTADEPDGPPTDLNVTINIRNMIRSIDPYHPVSLVLNCRDYYWKDYSAGSDIVMEDAYPIAINPIYSKTWSTVVTPTFGDAGCDGCNGNFYDQSVRLEEFEERKRVVGRKRELVTWAVPQAFDDQQQEFWWRVPTGIEEGVQAVIAWNHGAMGHCAWLASGSSPDLLNNASYIANQFYAQSSFLIDNSHSRRGVGTDQPYDGENGIDVAAWTKTANGTTETLVMAAQLNYKSQSFNITGVTGSIKQVLFGNITQGASGNFLFNMGRTSVAAAIISQ